MGRWAQRRIAGGGGDQVINQIVSAIYDAGELLLTYRENVSGPLFTGLEFTAQPGSHASTEVNNETLNSIRVTFGSAISSSGTVDYAGSVPGILNPQSFPY